MAKTTKPKINDKTLDVLQKTKKQPSAKGGSSSKKTNEPPSRASRSRSRSMSRTPARPPPAKTKKPAKKRSQSPNILEPVNEVIVPEKKAKSKKTTTEKKDPKPKAPPKKKAAPKKTEPKRVGKEPASTPKPRRRASTPKRETRARATPTRQSKRISTIYNSNPSNSMDTLDSPKGSNHVLNNKDVDSQSISSTSSTSSRRGWFSNCVIV